ncbi:hypothetical protein J7E24_09510 [Hymenobacter sp. ISL-91]|uniref:hypothetical protein n=1 Tax=Hymenobacter sp. ISL-91 TaxID=2819151 RepID=UPI001BE62AD5|nr:hypothetical protein [Hymenobacter sp. ISL-91]MBT2558021.1 hypothetical protein [Hymenobacter sp. ISL-91]
MTSNNTYQSVFEYLFDSVTLKQESESIFFKTFLGHFPQLSKEQQELKKSSRGESNGKVFTIMRFKDFSIRFDFNSHSLIEAQMKMPKENFFALKEYAKNKYYGQPQLRWENEMFGMMETLKALHLGFEASFTKVFGFGCEVTIKRSE